MEFPGNSINSRIDDNKPPEKPVNPEATSDPKTVKKVVTGKVTKRDKPLGKRFKDLFIHDGGNFAEHVVEKIVVPMVKDMALSIATQMVDGFRQGVEEMLFGPNGKERRGRTTSYGTGRPVVNYTRYSSTSSIRRTSDDRPSRGEGVRRSNRVKEIIVESRDEGDSVLEELDAIIDNPNVGHCTVGDFYAACGESTRSTDEEWGWTDLRKARVVKIDDGEYLIDMPRPRPIES